MSKVLTFLIVVIFVSCAHQRGPASIDGNPVAYDSMALGNVKASAVKRVTNKEVCFDINLVAKNVEQSQVQASNWTMAWIDQNDHYHLLPLTQREPASVPKGGTVVAPYGSYNEYANDFSTCISKGKGIIKGLVMTPKELPYDKKDGLKLSWEK